MNVNSHMKGRQVVTRDARSRRLAADFPGWGADEALIDAALLPTVAGMTGTVVSVNSHGSNPYTRYSIRLEDGSLIIDGVPGVEFDWKE